MKGVHGSRIRASAKEACYVLAPLLPPVTKKADSEIPPDGVGKMPFPRDSTPGRSKSCEGWLALQKGFRMSARKRFGRNRGLAAREEGSSCLAVRSGKAAEFS